MLRFDVNLSTLFGELPLLERPAAAARAGFRAVELWWPFPEPAPPRANVDALVAAITDAGLTLACLNFDGGDFRAGQRGLVSDPALTARFRANVPVALEIARRLDCRVLNALYGNVRPGLPRSRTLATAIDNLTFVARAASEIGARVVLEALNAVEYPAYGLHSLDEAATVMVRVRAETGERVGLLFDVYHVARSGLDVAATFRSHAPDVAHVQLADAPSRGKPGTGNLDVAAVLGAVDESDYTGWVGLEYFAAAGDRDPFDWLHARTSVAAGQRTGVKRRPLARRMAPATAGRRVHRTRFAR